MSNTGPFGHQPVSLSTGMGLSDPRLRRALQLTGLSDQKLGFGLKMDSQGRIAVDSSGLAGDSETIVNLATSFTNLGGNIFNTTITGTQTGQDVTLLNTIVGVEEWTTGDSSILYRLRGMGTETWEWYVQDQKKFTIGSVLNHDFDIDPSGLRSNLHWHAGVRYEGPEDMSQDREVAVKASFQFFDSASSALGPAKGLNNVGTGLGSPDGTPWIVIGRSTSTSGSTDFALALPWLDRLRTGGQYEAGLIDTVLYTDAPLEKIVPEAAVRVRIKYETVWANINHPEELRGPRFTIRDQIQYTQTPPSPDDLPSYDPLT